jgi:hypothetical protein
MSGPPLRTPSYLCIGCHRGGEITLCATEIEPHHRCGLGRLTDSTILAPPPPIHLMLHGIGLLSIMDSTTDSATPPPPMNVAIESAVPLAMDATTESTTSLPIVATDGSLARL